MATAKPRHSITFEQSDYDVLVRMAALQGGSVSKIVSELVASVMPALRRVVDLAEAAQNAQGEVRENLARLAAEAEGPTLQALDGAMGEWDALMTDLEGETGSDPRPVITGVRSPNPHTQSTPPKGKNR